MRFTSLFVELVRAQPKLIFWAAILVQSALWVALPMLLYRSPPGDVATLLAFGREYQVGAEFGPPLAFWLGDIAFRLAGNHMFGVYLLAQLCFIVTMWALFQLGCAIVGRQQAALAVLLTVTITVFSFPGVEFGPSVLARPLWALILLYAWQVMGQSRPHAWFLLLITAGLLLFTTYAAILLLGLMAVFMLVTRGWHAWKATGSWLALIVLVALVLLYLMWLAYSTPVLLSQLPPLPNLREMVMRWGELLAGLVFAMFGMILLAVLNSRWFTQKPEQTPIIFRSPVAPFAHNFVLFFACAPALVVTLVSAIFGFDQVVGSPGTVLLMAGLAVIVLSDNLIPLRRQLILRTVWVMIIVAPAIAIVATTLIGPWMSTAEVKTSLPAAEMGQFFSESFERRTGRRLGAVAGDAQIAALISLSVPWRPHVFYDAMPERTPWLTLASFRDIGGIVMWRTTDVAGTPPDEIAKRFPHLAPEVPRVFERIVTGRQPPLRIGWAIVRPKTL